MDTRVGIGAGSHRLAHSSMEEIAGTGLERADVLETAHVKDDNIGYWTKRAASYSEDNRSELASGRSETWKREILDALESTHPGHSPQDLKVLDIGCGPGIFSIALDACGYRMTSVDYTESMLEEARANAGERAGHIDFRHMDAEDLEFEDCTFDAIVSRNVTWNLPHPDVAYREWERVLKPGGVLVNFDANWYTYLYDDSSVEEKLAAGERIASYAMDGSAIRTNREWMESIAMRVPLSQVDRPSWDEEVLESLGMLVECDGSVHERVWEEGERELYAACPQFKVVAVKPFRR